MEGAEFVKIYRVAKPSIEWKSINAFLEDMHLQWNPSITTRLGERITELAARICKMSFSNIQRPTREIVRDLIDKGHESVLEHASWSFLICGVSRTFTHQLVRHRVGFSFSQLSQQYYEDRSFECIEPSSIGKCPEALEAWRKAVSIAKESYSILLDTLQSISIEDDIPKQERTRAIRDAARGVLPNSVSTVILCTANARALRHFLLVRGQIRGDEEMRRVSAALLQILQKDAPGIFEDFSVSTLSDGSPIVLHVSNV